MAKVNMDRVIVHFIPGSIPMIYDFLRDSETDEQAAERADRRRQSELARLSWNAEHFPRTLPDGSDYWWPEIELELSSYYKVMSYDEFSKLLHDYAYSMMILSDSTEEEFEEMLGVLPPLHHIRCGNVESFCLSEFEFDSYTHQYARDHSTGRYYKKLVNILDKSTWISEDLYPAR